MSDFNSHFKSLLYLSPGSIPSRWAHSGQIVKMSEALARQVPQFELVTAGDLRSINLGMDQRFMDWYSVHHPFKLVRLPVYRQCDFFLPKDYESHRFFKLAALYTYLKAPSLTYTRTGMIAKLLLRLGLPVVYESHQFWDPTLGMNLQDPNLVAVVTTLPQMADSYIQAGCPAARTLTLPNAADLDTFLPHRSPADARQQLGYSLDERLIVYSGHLYDYKGIPTILETARLMPDYQFVLVGGWEEDVMKVREICQNQYIHNVKLVGHVHKASLALYLYAADVLLLPTSSKFQYDADTACPLKLFDYMAVKKPIVCSNLPTLSAILRDRQNALLVEPDQPQSFQAAIQALWDMPALAQQIAEQAYADVQQYTWQKRADRILQFIGQQLAQAQPLRQRSLKTTLKGIQLMLT